VDTPRKSVTTRLPERYESSTGDSGVVSYDVGPDSITLQFKDGAVYLYTYEKPGKDHVERMKHLAKSGKGLSTYVSRNVRDSHARQLWP
jgi:hypothetical protein